MIDFSDNDIKKIDNFPTMNRLNTLLFHNNNISRIHPQIGKYLPNLNNMILNNNKIQHYYEIEHLSSFQKLTILSLLENPITYRQYYREYTIYKLNSLKVLDFQKISNKERKSIQSFFETNQSGKQFLIQVENEKNFYYQQLQQKSQQISSVLSSSAAAVSNNGNRSNGTNNVPPLPTPPPPASKPGQLVLTEDQKLQVKQAIERATTKEEIDLIEHQLKVRNTLLTVNVADQRIVLLRPAPSFLKQQQVN